MTDDSDDDHAVRNAKRADKWMTRVEHPLPREKTVVVWTGVSAWSAMTGRCDVMTDGHIDPADMRIESWNDNVDNSRLRSVGGYSGRKITYILSSGKSVLQHMSEQRIDLETPSVQSKRFRKRIFVSASNRMIYFQYVQDVWLRVLFIGWYELQTV
jgi:hypothetical protein